MNKKGFTLIEIAMVLVVIGILMSIGVGMMGSLLKQGKNIDARDVVKSAKSALSGYAVKNGFLPTTIGSSGARELDAWGRSLSYNADTTLLLITTNACNRTNTDRTVFECKDTVCTKPPTALTKSNVAFIVYSTGEDADGTGTTTMPTGWLAADCPVGNTCYWVRQQASSYTVGPTTYNYDDIVQYVTLDEIRSAMNCSVNITTQTLPDARVGIAYNATGVQLQASGGQTPYSWTVGAGLPSGITLSATGLLSGTPTTAGVYNFTVTLTDANNITTSKAFTLNVIETLEIVNASLPDAMTRVPYSTTLGGRGGVSPYTWSVFGQTVNTLGCPASTYPIAADRCYGGTGTATGTCTGTCIGGVCVNGNAGTCTGTCTTPNTYGVVGNETSAGFCLNSTTGVLSSTMTNATYTLLPGAYSFTVVLTDANLKTASKVFALNVVDYCSGFAGGGLTLYNTTTVRYFKKNNAATCYTLTATTGSTVVLPTDSAFLFYSGAACTTPACTTTPVAPISYASFINPLSATQDVNGNCAINLTATTATVCTFADR